LQAKKKNEIALPIIPMSFHILFSLTSLSSDYKDLNAHDNNVASLTLQKAQRWKLEAKSCH